MAKNEAFVTTREAAKLLGVSLRSVQLWVENGVLSAWKTAGGHRRIARNSLDEMLLRQKEAAQLVEAADIPEGHEHEMVLLVVEDSADLLQLYRRQIQSWELPLRLITAANGFEGLYQIGLYQPDFIISDLEMPGMDGIQMVWALYEQPDLKRKDIIVVTGLSAEEIRLRGGLPEEVPVLYKPIPFHDLREMLESKVKQTAASR